MPNSTQQSEPKHTNTTNYANPSNPYQSNRTNIKPPTTTCIDFISLPVKKYINSTKHYERELNIPSATACSFSNWRAMRTRRTPGAAKLRAKASPNPLLPP